MSAGPDKAESFTSRTGRSKAGHRPYRMCCICRTRKPKDVLYRYVCARNNHHGQPFFQFDPQQTLPGRGFYVCSDPGCEGALIRHRGWQKKCRG